MNRRGFIKMSSAFLVAMGFGAKKASANSIEAAEKEFRGPYSTENVKAGLDDLSLRFLGTGAAGWYKDRTRRRHSSVLIDKKVIIDFTESALDMVPGNCHPDVVFYTHSHVDHYDAKVALKFDFKRVYVSETWVERCKKDFEKSSKELNLPMPQIIPLSIGQKVEEKGLVFTAIPANHAVSTKEFSEQALIYLVEKGTTKEKLGVRLLYATDTGGITGIAGRLAGVDPHLKPGRPITAFIMEATIGMDMEEDWRILNHSTVAQVVRTVHMFEKEGRYVPLKGQPAYITHMSRTNWPLPDELDKKLPLPLRAARDGMDIVFRAQ